MLTAYTLNDRICAAFKTMLRTPWRFPPTPGSCSAMGRSARAWNAVQYPRTRWNQVEVIFERIRTILAASNMTFADVVKFTVYVTDKSILDDYLRVRGPIMGHHNPPATFLVVNKFPRPGVEVEIEAIAAKAD